MEISGDFSSIYDVNWVSSVCLWWRTYYVRTDAMHAGLSIANIGVTE